MKLPRDLAVQVLAHAHSTQPRECCGLIGGTDGQATTVYRCRNVAKLPERRYKVARLDHFRAVRVMRRKGEELLVIYHSHPRGLAYPSPTDRALAGDGAQVHLIASLSERCVRAFWLRDGEAIPAPLLVT